MIWPEVFRLQAGCDLSTMPNTIVGHVVTTTGNGTWWIGLLWENGWISWYLGGSSFVGWCIFFGCVCVRKIIFKPVAHLRWKNEPDTEPYMNLKVVSRKWHTVDGRSFRIAEYEDGYKEWLLGLKGFFFL